MLLFRIPRFRHIRRMDLIKPLKYLYFGSSVEWNLSFRKRLRHEFQQTKALERPIRIPPNKKAHLNQSLA